MLTLNKEITKSWTPIECIDLQLIDYSNIIYI